MTSEVGRSEIMILMATLMATYIWSYWRPDSNEYPIGILLKGMRKDGLRQRKREFEHAMAQGFPDRMN